MDLFVVGGLGSGMGIASGLLCGVASAVWESISCNTAATRTAALPLLPSLTPSVRFSLSLSPSPHRAPVCPLPTGRRVRLVVAFYGRGLLY